MKASAALVAAAAAQQSRFATAGQSDLKQNALDLLQHAVDEGEVPNVIAAEFFPGMPAPCRAPQTVAKSRFA